MKKMPWEEFPHIWKSEAAFMSFIRGGIRRSLWQHHPVKLEFIKKARKKIANPNPRGRVATVWGGKCALCGQDFPMKDLQVDHKAGNNSLKTMDDLQDFVEAITCITFDDLQLACKTCHNIKSHAERKEISFEQAKIEKQAIEFSKLPTKEQVDILKKHGVECSNAKARRQEYTRILEEQCK